MGMYDQIKATRVMPDGFQTDDWYQTNGLDQCLVDYEIKDSGELWEIGICGEADDRCKPAPFNFTGSFIFYHVDFTKEKPRPRHQYQATFENGLLVSLIAVDEETELLELRRIRAREDEEKKASLTASQSNAK